MPSTQPVPVERLVRMWRDDNMSLSEIATACGVSKQAISQRLTAAGYSPAARYAESRAAKNGTDYAALRAQRVKDRAADREIRIQRIQRECEAIGVRPYTLSLYEQACGPYAAKPSATPGNRAGTGKLPPRHSPDGEEVCQRLRDLCAPWSVQTIARLAALAASR